VPGNDDALRAIRLFLQKMADAIIEGRELTKDADSEESEAVAADPDRERVRRDDRERRPRREDRPRRDDRAPRPDAAPASDDIRAYRSADGRPAPAEPEGEPAVEAAAAEAAPAGDAQA